MEEITSPREAGGEKQNGYTTIPNQIDEALRLRLRKYAYRKCATQLKSFAECTKNKTISVVYSCNTQQEELFDCINSVTNQDNLDLLRAAFLRGELQKTHTYNDNMKELHKRLLLIKEKQDDELREEIRLRGKQDNTTST
ncbi:hypothetical protein AKO1_005027 [Acrasis kona]|uniref:COX assembly mitochondrial protein n=1 Tax=Acrasis kona TaxID=1008807 RepID=A0AAW2YLM9_9EUKA